jgi:hypothetical protein
MFWSGSGAFIRRHVETGEAQYLDWKMSFLSHRDGSGNRWLDVFHLSCSRHPLDGSADRQTGEVEIQLTARDIADGGMTTNRRLCLRISERSIELWIAAAGSVATSKPRSRRRALPQLRDQAAIEIDLLDGTPLRDGGTITLDGASLLDGGTIVLDGPTDPYRDDAIGCC